MRTFGSLLARANQIAAAICSEQVRTIKYCVCDVLNLLVSEWINSFMDYLLFLEFRGK